ncbi:S53 family peptidase [Tunturiibacter gelidoferens]|uniref:S53 family peptidase n=1 Tax=Tunturiibacter gelidiferens TaxID=3069689 RepID=A0AAU7YYM1_9BACT
MKHLRRVLLPLLTVALLVSSLPSFSQTPASQTTFSQTPEPRIKGPITEASRVVLSNSRTPRVHTADDLGALSSETPIPGITLVFKRSATQEATLQELLSAQQNPASPLYHQWLTPETFATRFGVADQDIAATQSWLVSRGFHIDSVSRSRDRITFSGTAAQVQAAFGTELHNYRTEGELHFAPAADLTLPAELTPVTAAVLHLSDFRPKPNLKVQTHPHPDYTTLATQTHYLGPQDIATMYDLNTLYSSGFTGSGQGLAVVGQSDADTTSAVSFFKGNLSPGSIGNISFVLVPGSGVEAISPGDEGESEIDLEYSSGIATEANIFFVHVGANQNYDVFDALAFTIDQNIAPVISISYGVCESLMSATDLDQGNALFERAAAQGQTIVAAAGDSGSTACVDFTSSGLSLTQQQALSVSYPADSPYVTAIGGTQMATGTFAPGSSQYWSAATNENLSSSLLSYVPEVVWNEGSSSFGIAAGGGGASTHFSRPTWQSAVPGIPSGAYRLLPDVALQSSIASPGFLFCSGDPSLTNSQGETASCANGLGGSNTNFPVAGGTSFATPIFAGLIAILNQAQQETGQGNINPILYGLASNPASYAAVFHDIVSGTNACASTTPSCAAPGESGYAATPGYDEATGLGSVDFGQLAKALPPSPTTKLVPTTIRINSVYTDNPGDIAVQISVEPAISAVNAAALTGSISVSLDGTVLNPLLAFPSTPYYNDGGQLITFPFPQPSTPGSHLLTVAYPGDATLSPSIATYAFQVGNLTATGSFTVAAANITVANGSQGSIPISATPAGGYSGRVAWSLAAATSTGTSEVCYFISASTTNNPNAATLNIGVGSACTRVVSGEPTSFRTLTSHASSRRETSSKWRSTPGIVIYAGLLVGGSFFTRRRRRLSPSLWLAVAFITIASLGLSGCGGSGGGSSGGTGNTTPPPNASTYTLTLTGTDSVNTAIKASTNFTLTVN